MVKVLPLVLGLLLGWSLTDSYYSHQLLDQADAYKASIEAVRTKEREWRQKANESEIKYQQELEEVKHSNSAELNRLRKQLNSYRMSSNTNSSGKFNDSSRESRVSEEFTKLAEFSDRCSRRADELIIQVRNLQSWIKETQ